METHLNPNCFSSSLFFCFDRHFELSRGLPLYTCSQTPVPGSPFPVPRSPFPVLVTSELFFSGDKSKYKIYRNKISTLSRLSKKLYYHDYFMTNSNDIKRTWEGINILINRKRKNDSSITALKRPGNGGLSHHTSDHELPNILNNHFASVGPDLAAKIPQSQTHFSSYLPKSSLLLFNQ